MDAITKETFISIDDVTDEQLEAWCISGISNNTIEEIQMHNLPVIQQSHKLAQMTTHYENTDT